ncbi:hypothetical protein [Pedobacter sp. UBA5917]|uniref:hypothetical protein n=1 Tax=Pedobacter sp. UBA5917 TaxID=1947061 RepID=UPI0025F0CEB2|nr:hypothetical protein [Pedobacter sp. UBA5917]
MKRALFFVLFFAGFFSVVAQQKVSVKPIFIDSSFDSISKVKAYESVKILDSVFNSDAFEELVLAEKFTVGNNSLSSVDILDLIRGGADNFKGSPKDYSIDLRLGVYDAYKGGKEYGNTKMASRITYTHRCYIIKNATRCYASHLAHEYMHEIGFYDVKSWEGVRRTKANSVPYKIGNIVARIIGKPSGCSYQTSTCKK